MTTHFVKEIGSYRARRGEFAIVTVPPLTFLMIDGAGDPNDAPAYRDAIAAIFPLAYGLKFLSRRELDRDYTVMPLEGLWWAADMGAFTTERDKSRWHWTLMSMVPDWLTADHLQAVGEAAARKRSAPFHQVRLERYDEGLSVQTLHVGSFDDEAPVLEAMHRDVIPAHGLRLTGRHHEIYLSDPRRTAPSRLRTILRQPVAAMTP